MAFIFPVPTEYHTLTQLMLMCCSVCLFTFYPGGISLKYLSFKGHLHLLCSECFILYGAARKKCKLIV
jgi:hypothetical protein